MNNNLKFLIDFHADLKIKQIKKNAFRDENIEKQIVEADLKKIIKDWVDSNIPVDKIDFESLKTINIKDIINKSQTKEALKKQILLIKKLAENEGWYEGEQDRSPTGERFVVKKENRYNQLKSAVLLLMTTVTFLGPTNIDPIVDNLVSQLLDSDLATVIWSTSTILSLIVDALNNIK